MFMMIQAIQDDKKREIIEEIYDRYHKYMTVCAMDILKNKCTAQESVQEAFCHIAATYELFEDVSAESTAALVYIYIKCAAVHILNQNKRVTKAVTFSEYTSRGAKNIAMEEADHESIVIDDETILITSEALDKLDEVYRDLMIMKHYYHMRNADIATVLQSDSTTVKNRVSRAKQALKESLGFAKDDPIDALLMVSIGKSVAQYAKVFGSLDVSQIVDDLRIKHRLLKRVKNKSCMLWRAIRVAAITCLLLFSLVFMVCMCISEVRNAMWNTLVVDDPVETPITSNDKECVNTLPETIEKIETPITPPQSIETIAKATYLPDGYSYVEMEPTLFQVSIIYYDASGNVQFILSQYVITPGGGEPWVDNEGASVTKISIHGFEGVLFEYLDKPSYFSLAWQDASYMYMMNGEFSSKTELLKIAESIKIE